MTFRECGLEESLKAFLRSLEGKNRIEATLKVYRIDIYQFIIWLKENNLAATTPDRIEKADITEYLTYLGRRGLTGKSRARKLAIDDIDFTARTLRVRDGKGKAARAIPLEQKVLKAVRNYLTVRGDNYPGVWFDENRPAYEMAITTQTWQSPSVNNHYLCRTITHLKAARSGTTARVSGR